MVRETLEGRVARLEEAYLHIKDDRVEAREDRKEIIQRLDGLTQTMQSTGNAISNLSLERCGERLEKTEQRLALLEGKTANLPIVENEVFFWRRVLGGGIHAFWKIAAFMVGSGGLGAVTMKLIEKWSK